MPRLPFIALAAFFIILTLAAEIETSQCANRVVEFTFQDVEVDPQLVGLRRGLQLKAGSETIFSAEVSGVDNNIVLPIVDKKDDFPLAALFHWGGAYNRTQTGISWTPDSHRSDNNPDWQYYEFGTDIIELPNGDILKDMTIALDRPGSSESIARASPMQSRIGLGKNSTLLNQLFDMGSILSRTWSLDIGWYGRSGIESFDENLEMQGDWDNGNLLLGGIDHGRYTGKLFEFDFAAPAQEEGGVDDGCHLKVTVVNIAFDFPGGGITKMLDIDWQRPMVACINPLSPVITLRDDVFNAISSQRKGPGEDFGEDNKPQDEVPYEIFYGPPRPHRAPDGRIVYGWGRTINMTYSEWNEGKLVFTFDNGFSATVDNGLFLVPDWKIWPDGTRYAPRHQPGGHRSIRDQRLLVTNTSDAVDTILPMLGAPFLSAVYLSVDNDSKKFKLGKSWRNTWNKKEYHDQNIGRVSAVSCPSPEKTSVATSTPDDISDTRGRQNDASTTTSSEVSAGIIAGATIGGVAGLAGLGILVWLICRRRKAVKKDAEGDVGSYLGMPEADSRSLKRSEIPAAELDPLLEAQELLGDDSRVEAPGQDILQVFEAPGDFDYRYPAGSHVVS